MSTKFLSSSSTIFTQNYYYLLFCTDIYGNLPDEVIKDSVHLGLHRSDYMINIDENGSETPLQVEINTIASSFGCLSKKVGDFHRFMLQRNANFPAYKNLLKQTSGDSASLEVMRLLSCTTISNSTSSLSSLSSSYSDFSSLHLCIFFLSCLLSYHFLDISALLCS